MQTIGFIRINEKVLLLIQNNLHLPLSIRRVGQGREASSPPADAFAKRWRAGILVPRSAPRPFSSKMRRAT